MSSERDEEAIASAALLILIEHHGMNFKDLAQVIDIPDTSVSRAMGGRRKWTWVEMCQLADHLQVSTELLRAPPTEVHRFLADENPPQRGTRHQRRHPRR